MEEVLFKCSFCKKQFSEHEFSIVNEYESICDTCANKSADDQESLLKRRLKFNDKFPKRGGYYYFNIDGKEHKLPSITRVLGIIDKSKFLIPWAAKKCIKIALESPYLSEDEIYTLHRNRDVTEAGVRGKGVHNCCTTLLKDPNAKTLEVYDRYVDGFRQFLKDYKPKEIFSEQPVYSLKYGIAGQPDLLLNIDDKIVLADVKTSPNIYPEFGLQLGFYAQAIKETDNIDIDRICVLHLAGKHKYTLVDVEGDMKVVAGLKEAYLWKEGQK